MIVPLLAGYKRILDMKYRVFIFLVALVVLTFGGKLGAQENNSTDFSLGFGSSFSSSPFFGSGFTSTVAPSFRWQMNENLSLTAGTLFSTSGVNNMSGLFTENPAGRFFSTTVYALGSYQLNPRLSITGGTYVERNTLEVSNPRLNPDAFSQDPVGMIFGFDYKVSENFSFGAQFNYSRGYDPFSPFNMQHSPFGGYGSPFRYGAPGIW